MSACWSGVFAQHHFLVWVRLTLSMKVQVTSRARRTRDTLACMNGLNSA